MIGMASFGPGLRGTGRPDAGRKSKRFPGRESDCPLGSGAVTRLRFGQQPEPAPVLPLEEVAGTASSE